MVKTQTGWHRLVKLQFQTAHWLERTIHTPCSATTTISKGHGTLVSRAFDRTPEPAKHLLQVLPNSTGTVCNKSWQLTLADASKAWERSKTVSLWEQPPPPPHRGAWKTSNIWTSWLRFELNVALEACHVLGSAIFHNERLANFFQLPCLTASFTMIWTHFRFKFSRGATFFQTSCENNCVKSDICSWWMLQQVGALNCSKPWN